MALDGGILDTKIIWNNGFDKRLPEALQKAQAMYSTEVLRKMDSYVPVDKGTLKNTAKASSHLDKGELIWSQPYARKVYYETGRTKGLRGKYWGERCKADNLEHFKKFAINVVSRAGRSL